MTIVTIVGARKAPPSVCRMLAAYSLHLRAHDVLVRTGDASSGVDHSVVHPQSHIMITEPDEMVLSESMTNLEVYTARDARDDDVAMAMAMRFHPAWEMCSSHAQLLHSRNIYQVAGLMRNNPSTCLLCWTPDGAKSHSQRSINTGGTGTAISVASEVYKIPVFNVRNRPAFPHFLALMESLGIPKMSRQQ